MIVAGESSGELYGALLAKALISAWPGTRIVGIRGERMQKAGVELISGISSALGLGEVLRSLNKIRISFQRAVAALRYLSPDAVVLNPESGNSLHVHRYEDEVVYVLEGSIEITLGDQMLQAVAGGVAHLPKQIPHALYNPMKTRSRYLAMAIPGGMDEFLR